MIIVLDNSSVTYVTILIAHIYLKFLFAMEMGK